jgi:rod shape-determining protein MreB
VLKQLRGLLSGGPYYVRFTKTRLSMHDVSSGNMFEIGARIGLDQNSRIVSVGDVVSAEAFRTIEPFNHPRVVIADFACAVIVLRYSLQSVSRLKWIVPAPILVLQPEMDLVAGISEIESRALLKIGESVGARRTFVHYGGLLTDRDVLSMVSA